MQPAGLTLFKSIQTWFILIYSHHCPEISCASSEVAFWLIIATSSAILLFTQLVYSHGTQFEFSWVSWPILLSLVGLKCWESYVSLKPW